jgi:glycosyltransferase involved in cell wall biosynthesis
MHDLSGDKKKFSIIIPTLNEEKLIERSLEQFTSEIKNSFNVELIVSDGGSTDSTINIAKKYADRLILHSEKFSQNISQGRNAGAKDSLGDVLIFLNADTCLNDVHYFFTELLKEFNLKDTAAVACRIEVFPGEKKLSDVLFHGMYNYYLAIMNKGILAMGRGECHIIKKENFFNSGGYDETLAAGEDFDIYKRLGKSGKIKFRRDLLVFESPRRYRRYGYAKVIWDWTINYLSVLFFRKSVSKEWKAVR